MKFNKLIPELSVSDYQKSLEFYTKILGFKVEYTRDGFSFLSLQGSQVMIQETNDVWTTGELEYPRGRGINLQIDVNSINPFIAALAKANHPLFVQPAEQWYKVKNTFLGVREFLVLDPDGYLLRFSEEIGQKKE